jgi:hypothetical protein
VTRETAASNAGPGRPERARGCLLAGQAGAAAAAGSAHDRPRPVKPPAASSTGQAGLMRPRPVAGLPVPPGPAHAREPAGTAPWLPPCQAPGNGGGRHRAGAHDQADAHQA